jgi:Mce-associated membrane protein
MGVDKAPTGPAVGNNDRSTMSSTDPDKALNPADALALAEQADAEAAEADAMAAAARARARAIRLRRQAAATTDAGPADATDTTSDGTPAVEETSPPDETPGPEPTDSAAKEAPGPARTRRARPSVARVVRIGLAAVAVLLIAAGVAVTVVLLRQHQQAVAQRQQVAEFNAAARQGVITLMSIDFNHAKEDVQRILDNSTGQFKSDFQAEADDMVKASQDAKVVTTASVSSTAVQSMTDDSAVVLVAATSEVTNSAGAKKDPRTWRMTVTVARDGGQLKLAKVEFVP